MERADLEALVRTYVDAVGRQDVDACTALFAQDAVQEDPLGSPPNVGHDAIRAFFEKSFQTPFSVSLDPDLRIGGDYVSFRFTITVPLGDTSIEVKVADLAKVGSDGLITQLWAIQDMG